MIGLGFNTATKERLMQEYPEGCKVDFLANYQDISAGEVGTILQINDDLGITVQITPERVFTLYEVFELLEVL